MQLFGMMEQVVNDERYAKFTELMACCLVVGRVYCCSRWHELVAYHPGILKQIPNCFIPFRMWHITGFTSELINLTISLVTAGMSLSGIRSYFHKRYEMFYYNRKQ